jgi:uncharacterized protein (DUF58 family)
MNETSSSTSEKSVTDVAGLFCHRCSRLLHTSNPGLREHYHTDFEQRLARIHELSRQREIPVLPLSTAEPVPEQVRRLLSNRPEAQRRP